MNRILLLLFFVLLSEAIHGQVRPVQQENPNVNQRDTDTSSAFSRRSTSNRNLKNVNAKIVDYKIISHEQDTIYLDTTLTTFKDYKFNYLRKDDFDVLPFANLGQTYNTLSYDFSSQKIMPLFGARARHFNYREIEDVNYFYVPTPLTELMFKTAFEQGQLLDAFFTVNTTKQFNFSIAYKGLRSLGKYQHALTSTGNFRFTSNYKTKNNRYKAKAHIFAQDLLNQENGGIRDEDIENFESGNPEFIDRSVFDPQFEDAENILEGKRFHLDHEYVLVNKRDSIKSNSLTIGNIVSFTHKYYQYKQSNQNDFFGEAFENQIHERTTLEDFYAEANTTFKNNTLGTIRGFVGYSNFNYGYDKLVQVGGTTITNRLTGDVISAGGGYENKIGKLDVKGRFGINISGDFTGNYLTGKASFKYNDDLDLGASININSRAPNYNFLLYQSDYINYNWQNNFDNVQTKHLAFHLRSEKIANVDVDYTTINNHAYFSKDVDGFVKPNQFGSAINYVRVKVSREFKYGKFGLDNTIRYQSVIDGEGILNVPEFVTRNTLYYANHFFENNALYLQTGITFSYFTSYNMNGYDPVLAEFYTQNNTSLGGFPLLDFFVNMKVRQTRIFFKAEHFNSSFTGYNYYSAPNYPYRDFVIRFGLVWNFFL